MPRYNPQRVRIEPTPTPPAADYLLAGLVFGICAAVVVLIIVNLGRIG